MKNFELDQRVELLFSDVDKTILTSDYRLLESVVAAFKSLQRSGVKVVLATARSPQGVAKVARALNIDQAICFNGGWIGNLETGVVVSTAKLDRATALSVMEAVAKENLSALWYADEGVFVTSDNEAVRMEAEITGEPLSIVDGIEGLPGEPFKIMIVRRNRDNAAFDHIREIFADRCGVVMSNPRLLEVTPTSVSKGTAAQILATALKVGQQACAAAGDAENDLTLLTWVTTPLTTANAIVPILAMAKFVGPSVEEGGMASVIEWLEAENVRAAHQIA